MTVTAPETVLRHILIDALTAEFAAEAIEFGSDKLNDSLGRDGTAVGAVFPGRTTERGVDVNTAETTVYVQLFDAWKAKVDAKMVVDPDKIEEWAERVRRAAEAVGPKAPIWFYRVQSVEFPDDPTGNKSRLLATVVATMTNPAVIHTTG